MDLEEEKIIEPNQNDSEVKEVKKLGKKKGIITGSVISSALVAIFIFLNYFYHVPISEKVALYDYICTMSEVNASEFDYFNEIVKGMDYVSAEDLLSLEQDLREEYSNKVIENKDKEASEIKVQLGKTISDIEKSALKYVAIEAIASEKKLAPEDIIFDDKETYLEITNNDGRIEGVLHFTYIEHKTVSNGAKSHNKVVEEIKILDSSFIPGKSEVYFYDQNAIYSLANTRNLLEDAKEMDVSQMDDCVDRAQRVLLCKADYKSNNKKTNSRVKLYPGYKNVKTYRSMAHGRKK